MGICAAQQNYPLLFSRSDQHVCFKVIRDRTAPPQFAFDPVPQLVGGIGLSVGHKCHDWWPLEIAEPANDLIRVGMGG